MYLNDFHLDIVPYGGIITAEDKIFWPPDQSFAMTVLGFEEAEKVLVRVKIDEVLEIDIVSMTGIFILKLVAWKDRDNQVMCILTEKRRKATSQENKLQSIIRMLNEEYGFDLTNMERDFTSFIPIRIQLWNRQ